MYTVVDTDKAPPYLIRVVDRYTPLIAVRHVVVYVTGMSKRLHQVGFVLELVAYALLKLLQTRE